MMKNSQQIILTTNSQIIKIQYIKLLLSQTFIQQSPQFTYKSKAPSLYIPSNFIHFIQCQHCNIISALFYFYKNMQKVSILPLGAGCEVGRSCLILTINNKKIMLDCGLMINKGGEQALPLFDKVEPEELSMIIITHAHLDHCGALPYFLSTYPSFKKKVYMTKPTEHIYHYLVRDTLKVRNQDKVLFSQDDVTQSMARICSVRFGVQLEDEGIKITPFVAGHIVGAAMFVIEVDGVKVLYTGDYSCEEDRYIMQAQIPQTNVDILISESTFGTNVHQDRNIREQNFREEVKKIVKRGGKCLLPVFSAGRAQELLFILDQFWDENIEELKDIRIYYTIELIDKCKKIYQTYIDMLSEKIKQRFYKQTRNPFEYKHIHYLRSKQKIEHEQKNPMVVMCTPGMLQNGQSRTLLESWCHDPRNGVIITGYCAEGSIASNLKKTNTIVSMHDNQKEIKSKLTVHDISFAAHADCVQTTKFIRKLKPLYVVLVHGSSKNAENLREYLEKEFPEMKKVACPKNQEQLQFQIEITDQYLIAGELKNQIDQVMKKKQDYSNQFQGYIVNSENHRVLVSKDDKDKFFPQLQSMQILERIRVNYSGGLTLAMLLAQRIFGDAELQINDGDQYLVIKKKIKMHIIEPGKTAQIEFKSSPKSDIIADQFCYLLSNILYDPLLQKNLMQEHEQQTIEKNKNEPQMDKKSPSLTKQYQIIFKTIEEDYPKSVMNSNSGIIDVRNHKGENIGVMNLKSQTADSQDQYMKMRMLGIITDIMNEQ